MLCWFVLSINFVSQQKKFSSSTGVEDCLFNSVFIPSLSVWANSNKYLYRIFVFDYGKNYSYLNYGKKKTLDHSE